MQIFLFIAVLMPEKTNGKSHKDVNKYFNNSCFYMAIHFLNDILFSIYQLRW